MAFLIEYSTGGDDMWLRDYIRGLTPRPVPVKRVVVETGDEAHRIVHHLPELFYQAKKPYGGAMYAMAHKTVDGRWEWAKEGRNEGKEP